MPSFKLRSKQRVGARVVKRFDPPMTPLERALLHRAISPAQKRALRTLYRSLDPWLLFNQIRAAQGALGERVDHRGLLPRPSVAAPEATDLGTRWKRGGDRRSHRRPYVRRKPIPRRPGIFDLVLGEIDGLLLETPGLTAEVMLAEIRRRYPDNYEGTSTRTMQRVVKAARERIAKVLIGDQVRLAPAPVPGAARAAPGTGKERHLIVGNIPS